MATMAALSRIEDSDSEAPSDACEESCSPSSEGPETCQKTPMQSPMGSCMESHKSPRAEGVCSGELSATLSPRNRRTRAKALFVLSYGSCP